MPLFKVWSEDKLNKKFVVAENFSELVSNWKVNDSVYIRLFHDCMAWKGGGFDPGGVLPQILDRGVPRRFLNPNPI